jgi:hypothetical protein
MTGGRSGNRAPAPRQDRIGKGDIMIARRINRVADAIWPLCVSACLAAGIGFA